MGLMSWWGWYREQRFALDSTLRERWADLRERFADRCRGRAEWASAETLAELGEVTAEWLEGEFRYHPNGHDEGPDPETEEIAPELIKLNRAGFVTKNSQPGIGPEQGWDGNFWWQRAEVTGFTDSDTADKLEAACRKADLIFIRNGPASWRTTQRNSIPITVGRASAVVADDDLCRLEDLDGTHIHTGSGTHLSRRWVKSTFDGYGTNALVAAEQVAIVDPVYGRKSYMWDVITKAITPPCCPCREH